MRRPYGPNPVAVAVLGCVEGGQGATPKTRVLPRASQFQADRARRGATGRSLLSIGAGMPLMDSPALNEKRWAPVGGNTRALFSFVPFF